MAKTARIIVVCMCQWFFWTVATLAADDCEVIKAIYYERVQGEIVTEPGGDFPYRRYQTVVYPCADVTVRDNYGSLLPRVVEITAFFSDESMATKIGWCDKKSLGNEVGYFCIACFESNFLISDVACRFK